MGAPVCSLFGPQFSFLFAGAVPEMKEREDRLPCFATTKFPVGHVQNQIGIVNLRGDPLDSGR